MVELEQWMTMATLPGRLEGKKSGGKVVDDGG